MRTFLIVLCALTVFSTAHASEFFYQAPADQNVLTPQLGLILSQKIDDKTGGYLKSKGPVLILAFERGLSEQFAIEAITSYASVSRKDENKTKNDIEGLGDLNFRLKGVSKMEQGNLRYGVLASFSPGDSEVKANESNNYSGRHALTPYVGYEIVSGDLTFGAAIECELLVTDLKQKTLGVDDKYSDGQTLNVGVFLETVTAVGQFGGHIQYATTSDFEKESTGAKIEQANLVTLGAYGTRTLESAQLIYGVDYHRFGSTDVSEGGDGILLNFGARFAL